jgi:hypothetical protein
VGERCELIPVLLECFCHSTLISQAWKQSCYAQNHSSADRRSTGRAAAELDAIAGSRAAVIGLASWGLDHAGQQSSGKEALVLSLG